MDDMASANQPSNENSGENLERAIRNNLPEAFQQVLKGTMLWNIIYNKT